MNWSFASGSLQVEILQPGPQSVELLTLSGRSLAQADCDGRRFVTLPAPDEGVFLLRWRSGERQAIAKVAR